MKTHIPVMLRKALLAAMGAAAAVCRADTLADFDMALSFYFEHVSHEGEVYEVPACSDLRFTKLPPDKYDRYAQVVIGTVYYGIHAGPGEDIPEYSMNLKVYPMHNSEYDYRLKKLLTWDHGNMPEDRHEHESGTVCGLGSYSAGNVDIIGTTMWVYSAQVDGTVTLGDREAQHEGSAYSALLDNENGLTAGGMRLEDASTFNSRGGATIYGRLDIVEGSRVTVYGDDAHEEDLSLEARGGIALDSATLEARGADVVAQGVDATYSAIDLENGSLLAGNGGITLRGGALTGTRDLYTECRCKVATEGGGDMSFSAAMVKVQDDVSSSGKMTISDSVVTVSYGGGLHASGEMTLASTSTTKSIKVEAGSIKMSGSSQMIVYEGGIVVSHGLTDMSGYSLIDVRNASMQTNGLSMDLECKVDARQGGVITGNGDISLSESSTITLDDYAKLQNVGNITVASHSSITATYRSQISNTGNVTVTGNGSFISVDKGDMTVTGGCLTAEKWGKVEVSVGNIYTQDMLAATSGTIVVTEGDVVATGDVSVTKDAAIQVDGHVTADSIHVDGANAVLQASNVTVGDKLYVSNSGLAETGSVEGSVEVRHARLDAAGVGGDAAAMEGGVLNLESVAGKVTADASSVVVESSIGAGVEAANNATVQAADISGPVTAAGHAKVEAKVLKAGDGTVSATGEDTLVKIAGELEAGTVQADRKAVVEAMTITADTVEAGSGATVKVRDTITADVAGTGGNIAATGGEGKGLTILGDVAGTGSTFTAAADTSIDIACRGEEGGNLTGSGNILGMDTATLTPLASRILVDGDISGDGNELYATNKAVGAKQYALAAASISGDGNTLRVMNAGGNRAMVEIGGDITGNGNDLAIEGEGDIGVGNVSGYGNSIKVWQGGDIIVEGVLGQMQEGTAAGNSLAAAGGDVVIGALGNSSGLGVVAEQGSITVQHTYTGSLQGSSLVAGEDITIGKSGSPDAVLTLDGDSGLVARAGSVQFAQSATLLGGSTVKAGNDVVLAGTTELADAVLSAGGHIRVTEGTVVHLLGGATEALDGRLDGTGTVVSGAEDLVRTQDDTAFSGTVDMQGGRSLTVAGAGLGAESTVNLGEHSYLFVSGDGSSLGTVKVGRDGGIAMTPAPASAKLMARGVAYAPAVNHATADILDFAGKNSMYGVEVLGGDADCITVTGLVKADPAKTSVYVANEADLAAQQDGTYTIIKLADGAAMEGGMNTDVAYTMQGSQRALVGKNLAVVNTAKGVDLVVSTNAYGTQAVANKKAVQAPLAALSAQVDHSTGALDGAEDEMLQVLNALDHTTAAGDAAHALQQLSAVGNLIAPNMMIDTTRHHMDTLRQHMSAASCAEDGRKTSHVWAAYQGGHDVLGGDEAMDDVKTSYQGALVGVDFSVNCNTSVGISLGYENAEGRSAGDRAETDTLYLDLYATAKTGSFIHRVSLGMAMYDFDVTRHVAVAAGNRSYSGTSRGSMDAMSWTLGYEVSRPCALGEHAMLTPFAQVDVALHTLDSLHSNGQGSAEVATDYDDMCRVDVALGAAWQYAFANGVSTSARLALHGDLGDERVSGTNRFAAGGPAWQTEGLKRTPLYGELGGGISVPLGSSWTGAANVGFEFGGDRTSVGGNVGVNYAF